MTTKHILRIRLIFIALFLFALVLIGRLFFLQVVKGNEYAERADDQYIVSSTDVFDRGSIFLSKRNGDLVSVAGLKSGYIVAINPKKISSARYVYDRISNIIPLNKEKFFLKANKKNDPYEEIANKISKADAYKIMELGLQGVSISKQKWRFYPAGQMASHTIGFVAFRENDLVGRYGLEHYYEDVLSRTKNNLYINFFAEIFSNIADSILVSDNSQSGDIVITIEPFVQAQLEKILESLMDKWNSESVGGIVINPYDGSIYAMSAKPDFNPNNFANEKNASIFANPLVESVFEMGSIVKPLVLAAAIDNNVITAKTMYDDKGYIILNNSRIENFDGKARGYVSMQEVLNQSLNTGMVFVMQKLGHDKFKEYILSYGFGEESGIDLPGEVAGFVENLNSSRDIEYATASFGQGIATTPIGITRTLATLANGGKLITPYLVEQINYETGRNKKTYPDEGMQVLKKESAEEITRMLVEAVDKALLDGTVALPRYSIAAKTGTAQMADMENGGYYEDKVLHSFFGYFPAYEPKFLIFLYNVAPDGARYASQTLTHPFMDMTKFLINYYEIEPDR